MALFKNKYRIESLRLPDFDYSQTGYYFITICTNKRQMFFGDIINDKMRPTKIGKIVKNFWFEIPNKFQFAEIDEFILMPNHIHGIIFLNRIPSAKSNINTNKKGGFVGEKNPMLNENLSRIIRWFKGRVTFEARKIEPDFAWQTRFYDRIIRTEKELFNLRNYVRNNHLKWDKDELNIKRNG